MEGVKKQKQKTKQNKEKLTRYETLLAVPNGPVPPVLLFELREPIGINRPVRRSIILVLTSVAPGPI